eukprot:83337_1
MRELIENRKQSRQQNDEYMAYYFEQTMLDEICREVDIKRTNCNVVILKEILRNWNKHNQIEMFRNLIFESTLKCIKNDNRKVLNVILEECAYSNGKNTKRAQEMAQFINVSKSYESFNCHALLCVTMSINEHKSHNV